MHTFNSFWNTIDSPSFAAYSFASTIDPNVHCLNLVVWQVKSHMMTQDCFVK